MDERSFPRHIISMIFVRNIEYFSDVESLGNSWQEFGALFHKVEFLFQVLITTFLIECGL